MTKWKKSNVIKAFDEALNPPKPILGGLAEKIKSVARKIR